MFWSRSVKILKIKHLENRALHGISQLEASWHCHTEVFNNISAEKSESMLSLRINFFTQYILLIGKNEDQ